MDHHRTAPQQQKYNTAYVISMMPPPADCHSGHVQPQQVSQQPAPATHSMPMQDMVAEQNRLQESLNRSITLVFWYKAGCDPIRVHQEIPTFPLFQLSQFQQLVTDLGFSATSYVDMYNPHSASWEQQTIATVRVVESEQRLLYRVRKSFLEGLATEECPGVMHEISMQPQLVEQMEDLSPRTTIKRPSSDATHYQDAPHPRKYVRMDTGGSNGTDSVSPTRVDTGNRGYSQVMSVHMQSPSTDVQHAYSMSHQSQMEAQPQSTPHSTNESPSMTSESISEPVRTPFPTHPHPPLKRWPNDYCVSEIASGFRQMDQMIAQQPSVTQKLSFERVFGCRYIKSTVCRHRAVWKRADPTIKDSYEAMGLDERAVWGDFVKKVEGKLSKDSAASSRTASTPQLQQPQPMTLMTGVSSVAMGAQHGGLDHGVSRRMDEPAMASLGPPPPGHPGPGSLHAGTVA
ncbi:hypothetical protein EIP91_001650 [Steccherinum ochraceum]|uniref:Uncharacterized protein n=1 Tax=Steccherinum ochraceum TaxID=92696 RepID=A0A4R0RHD1_9APHY|nr:hypothetical protein EIP91_001650 [Steccherinum ochraceum]